MGLQSEILAKAHSVGDMLRQRVDQTPEVLAFKGPKVDADGEWVSFTWEQTRDIVYEIAAGLLARGLEPQQRVGIISSTRLEWVFTDLGISCAAGATTTVYPNTANDDVEYILSDSDSVMVVVENAVQFAKVQASETLRKTIHTVIVIDDTGVPLDNERIISLTQLRQEGVAHLENDARSVDDAIDSTGHDCLATLIYTSGTTGQPKGVRLPHRCWVYEAYGAAHWDLLTTKDVQYLWLPLSHVFGKTLIAVQLAYGFASAVDGRLDRIVQGLGEVQPTFMCGAPRIFEKVRVAALTKGGLSSVIARWAFSIGTKARPFRLENKPLPRVLKIQNAIADKLVFSKLRKKLGGRLRFLISGSAKLSSQVQLWFYSAGILVIEGYGSTETSAIATLNLPTHPEFGTVGEPMPGIEMTLADDGEVLFRGPIIADGYHKRGDDDQAAFDADGWYHTGDIGELSPQGNLRITDRKKDLFKTSGGKYVAPQKVEGAITANIPYVSQAVAVGDGRKYCSALLVMDPALLQKWAEKRDLGGLSYAELTQRPELRASVERQLAKANARLERWETVKRFAILPEELTVENEAVTPNMKIRRAKVAQQYAEIIDSLYDKED